jgi:type IV pilus assembly protein PilC
MDAPNKAVVHQKLQSQDLKIVKLKRKPLEINLEIMQQPITARDLMIFTRQFSTMIDAGLPMVQCLDILGNQADNPTFKKVLLEVKASVENGQALADALKKHPKVFDKFFVNLVAAGEAGGILDTILVRLAESIEKSANLNKQIKSALSYPILVLVTSLVIAGILLIFVIPSFKSMFEDMGQSLPWLTTQVIIISEYMQENIGTILITLGGLGLFGTWSLKDPRGRCVVDSILLELPAIGDLAKKVSVARFSRTMGTMLSSGVPILDALDIVAATSGNLVVEKGLLVAKTKISEGKQLSVPLSEMGVFPPMVVQMISVGEKAGAMDTMLNKIADFYDDEVDTAIGTTMSLLQPALMAFLAVVLGGLVISMYLPVINLAGNIG